ncbi:sporulation protein YqfD [Heliophilum fasciatum]|uniref:Stage IV sporulation protein n=1 Tax=Heliophilum fasciatum TaxID=35700 RepID=A0A4R2RNE9_9FIRM|nr:sporulation protein YqfD [Heliophilum fasciatum]MCW2278139.1 hypothetical protein [Heliophilum fasciatum]TCP64209.1 hypothetical protein EDD73_11161 [Heliophilum fasciatum]
MLRQWWLFWLGFLRIRVEGENLEKFINLASSRGVPLFDVSRKGGDRLSGQVRLDGYRSLRHVARRTNSRMRIERRSGFPFLLVPFKRRRSLWVGMLLFVAVLYALASLVWSVEITGAVRLDKQAMQEQVRSMGLRVGAWKPLIDTRQAEQALLAANPELEWVGIKLEGTSLIVELQEKILPSVPVPGATHMVAAKDGVVQRVLVLVGQGVVEEGATVVRGQQLIAGVLKQEAKEQERPDPKGKEPKEKAEEMIFVQAKGEVWAKVPYQVRLNEPVALEGKLPTGQVSGHWRIKWGEREMLIYGSGKSPYPDFDQSVTVMPLSIWRNLQIPVELVKVEFRELRPFRQERSREEALATLTEQARQQIRKSLSPGARIVKETVVTEPAALGHVQVRMDAEAYENIAMPQPVDRSVPPG